MAADGEHKATLDRLRAARAQQTAAGEPVDVEAALARVGTVLSSSLRGAQRRSNLVTREPRLLRPLGGLAMTAAVATAVAILVVRGGHTTWREYATHAGQRQTVTLSDGTRFTLAPASRLRVPVDYATGNRAVTLDGEALFAVVHDAANPFSVRARNAVATDIGTQFDVRAYASDRAVRIEVIEGRVRVGAAGGGAQAGRRPPAPVGLTAGDVAVIDTVLAVTHGANVTAMTAWANGELVFHAAPLAEAARELSRWYDLDVRVVDTALGDVPLTASDSTQTPDQVLSLVTAAVGARYERRGRVVTISPK